MKDIVNVAIDSARIAGDFLIDNFGKISQIEKKGDRNFATNLDREAEVMIIEKIKDKFPEHGIVAEESGKQNLTSDYTWIIDPLDGTHNFMRNIDIFGVSIGIVYKNEFVCGVIYMPKDKHMYVGQKGNGAYRNDKKISVSSNSNLKDCSISFDSSIRYSPDNMLRTLGALAKEVFNVRMFGSSARVLSYIADGTLDFAVEFHDRPWDFAGGVSIIEEAGGKLTTLGGDKLKADTIGYIASNNVTHTAIEQIVAANIKR